MFLYERVLLYLSITAGSARRHDEVSPQIQQGWSAALRFSLWRSTCSTSVSFRCGVLSIITLFSWNGEDASKQSDNNTKNKHGCQNPFKIKCIKEDPHTFHRSKINLFAIFWCQTFIRGKKNEMQFCSSFCFWDCFFNILCIIPGKETNTDSLISIPLYDFEPRSETIREKNCSFSIVQL